MGVILFTEPVDGGDPCFGREDVIGQDTRLRAEGMLGREQEVAALVSRVGCEQQATASGLE
jgi:hypothetical protein